MESTELYRVSVGVVGLSFSVTFILMSSKESEQLLKFPHSFLVYEICELLII